MAAYKTWASALVALVILLHMHTRRPVLVWGSTCTAGLSCDGVHIDVHTDSARDDGGRRENTIRGRTPERVDHVDSSDVFFSVKTAGHYHEPRLSLLLLTWLQAVSPHQVSWGHYLVPMRTPSLSHTV